MATVNNAVSNLYNLSRALVLDDVPQYNPLAPAAQPLTMLGEQDAVLLDERMLPQSQALLMEWVGSALPDDPQMHLPGQFEAAFDVGRQALAEAARDGSLSADDAKALRQAARLAQEFSANRELASFYTRSVQQG